MKSQKKVVFLLGILTCFSLVLPKSVHKKNKIFEPRIIGGSSAYAGQFPFAAAVYVSTVDGTYFCGGALISNEWILTAGQCVNGAIRFNIYLGSNNLQENETSRVTLAANHYILHPEYEPLTLYNDIGLIKLRMPISFTDYIKPITLTTEHLHNYSPVLAIGWGETSDSDTSNPSTLNGVSLEVIPNYNCKYTFGYQISEDMVCAEGYFNQGICRGDSGSPLIYFSEENFEAYHVGIASFFSQRGCETIDPSGFTRTYPYFEWIKNATNTF